MQIDNSGRAEKKASDDPSKQDFGPSEENKLVKYSDEANPLNDRTPAGDMGPEDGEKAKGSIQDEASY